MTDYAKFWYFRQNLNIELTREDYYFDDNDNLTSLTLGNEGLLDDNLLFFPQFKNLKRASFHNNALSNILHFAKFANLEYLYLNINKFSNVEDVFSLVKKLKNLKHLDLRNNEFSEEDKLALKKIEIIAV